MTMWQRTPDTEWDPQSDRHFLTLKQKTKHQTEELQNGDNTFIFN